MKAFHYFMNLAVMAALLSGPAMAATETHGHTSLYRNSALTYSRVFELAVENAPESLATQPLLQQAYAYQKLGNSWLSGTPKAVVNYLDDSSFDNTGARELEAGIEWQLWNPGGKSNSRKLGQSYKKQVEAWQNYLKLFVAGKIRSVLIDIRRGELLLDHARQNQTTAQRLIKIAEQQLKAGEIPRTAVMQARSLLLQEEKNVLEAEAKLVDAERMYRSLTGLQERPATDYSENQSTLEDITPNHPLLNYLQTSIEIAGHQVFQARQEASGNPTLSLGMRRDRGNGFEDYTNSLAIGFSIPIGGSAYSSTKTSDANKAKVDTEIQYETTYRQLMQQLHETEHELAITREAISLSETQTSLNQQQADMARKSFELGEININLVIQALQQFQQANTEYKILQLKEQNLISEFNQTVGVMP